MNYGEALELMKSGKRVARTGWNGKDMFIAIQEESIISAAQARGGVAKFLANDGVESIKILSHIDMKATDGSIVVGWLASQTDMLAGDWQEV